MIVLTFKKTFAFKEKFNLLKFYEGRRYGISKDIYNRV